MEELSFLIFYIETLRMDCYTSSRSEPLNRTDCYFTAMLPRGFCTLISIIIKLFKKLRLKIYTIKA